MNDASNRPRQLTDGQRARLRERLAEAGRRDALRIERRSADLRLPLSYAQEQLWFLSRLESGAQAGYAIRMSLELTGRLDSSALNRAIELVLARHEALRTVFVSDSEGVSQVVRDPTTFSLAVHDLSTLERALAEERAMSLRREESERGFDLGVGPLFRARLIRFGDLRHELLLGFHHIVADGWGIGLFVREVAECYKAIAGGIEPSLSELPIQYADYALWQRRHLQGTELERQLEYWRSQLSDLPVLELAPDHVRPAVATFNGASERVTLSAGTTEALRALSREMRATLFMTLLAAFKVLLLRHTGQTDLAVGTPVANRTRPEIERLIGFFVNSVVIRTQIQERWAFRDVLSRVRDVCYGAFEHQETPFEKLVEAIAPGRDVARNPLFQIAFNLLDATATLPESAGVQFGALRGMSEATRFDLEAHVVETNERLIVDFLYNPDLFEADTIRRLLDRYVRVLESVKQDPGVRACDIELTTEAERAAVLAGGTGVALEPPTATLGARFLATAAAQAAAVAIEDGTVRWTYEVVARQARQLAGLLQAAGVGPNVAVGVWLERGAPLVTTLVGIAVAGGAYVPLEPTQPAARAAGMWADADVRVVVTTAALAASVPAGPWPVVTWEQVAAAVPAAGPWRGTAADRAYVLYTSGSTGRPKGVAVAQAAVLRLVCGADYVRLDGQTVMGQAASVAFDAATFEVWGALLHGGRLVVVPAAVAVAPAALGAYLQRTGVTTLFLTTALVHQIGREWPGALASVATVLFGGEAVEPRWVAAIQGAGGPRRLVHVYGPTETTTFATWYRVPAVGAGAATIPIGGPIAGTTTYVLDAAGAVAPLGVVGELCVGGGGVAEGYVGAPRLTAARFVPDAYGSAPGGRLYRTGDRVRWQAAGVLRFLGRRDRQIKLRGHRIELGEVEAALGRAPGVGAAVLDVAGAGDERRLVAYVTPAAETPVDVRAVREALKGALPGFMVPAEIVALAALPLTANGKVDRAALPALALPGAETGAVAAPRSVLEHRIAAVWCEVLGLETVGVDETFFDVGGHSLLLVRVQAGLEAALGQRVPLVTLFQYPTVAALAGHLTGPATAASPPAAVAPVPTADAIAIIGMAGRFPGAPDVATFWANLRAGRETIRTFSREELLAAGVAAALVDAPQYVPARGALADVEQFDAGLFGYAPREAALLDPQQRLLLECAWTALEAAGYAPGTARRERIGVYAGTSANTYLHAVGRAALAGVGALQALVASDKDFLATRVSYQLHLQGPAVTVQTACSTSLVAVHVACQALRAGECEVALAGGVAVTVPAVGGYVYQAEGIASPDGHCRPFDARAAGTVAGNGVGLVVLKPLAAAVAAGDVIQAVIRGTAINNDGAAKVGFTAPSVEGQAAVIAAAQAAAGVGPETITYVEAHGTGTPLGDPIEVAALRQVWGATTTRCALGAVKGNVGHLDAAAGVTGLIKTVLALTHREVPPTLHFTTPNPQLDLGPFEVPTVVTPWAARAGGPRRAGVSAFGMGGTNAHLVLEEAPPPAANEVQSRPWQVVPISGQTPEAVAAVAAQLAAFLNEHPATPLESVAYTRQVGRTALPIRRVVVGRDVLTVAADLQTAADRTVTAGARPFVWLFPGQGAQHLAMGRALYDTEPLFRSELDACAAVVRETTGGDSIAALYPEEGETSPLAETQWTQVALVAVELALARLWRGWGLTPSAVVGHSVGEISAACVAGVLTREAALTLVAARGRLMSGALPGGMLAVAATAAQIAPRLSGDLALAAINTSTQCVVAGPLTGLAALESELAAAGIGAQRLTAAGAFHSPLMADVADPLTEIARTLTHRSPQIHWISTVTGRLVDGEPSPDYWGGQVTATVRWADAAAAARQLSPAPALWLEVGPGRTLSGLVRAGASPGETAVASLAGDDAARAMSVALGELWAAGLEPDWGAYHAGARPARVALPTYPFQRQRYWLEGSRDSEAIAPRTLARTSDVGQWLYEPCWKQMPRLRAERAGERCLVFVDDAAVCDALGAALRSAGATVTTVRAGNAWSHPAPGELVVDVESASDYRRLLESLDLIGGLPTRIIHARSVSRDATVKDALASGFYSLLFLTQALAGFERRSDLPLLVLSSGMQRVRGDEPVSPAKAALLGLCRVIPQEHPTLRARSIDIEPDQDAWDGIAGELLSDADDPVVAWRHGRRWVRTFERLDAQGTRSDVSFKPQATYLVTGGVGRLGAAVAKHLAAIGAHLVLVSRTASAQADSIREIESAGGRPMIVDADVSDVSSLRRAVEAGEARFGPIRGVLHFAGATADEDFVPLVDLDRSICERHFLPKLQGAFALDDLFKDRSLDFCVLASSIAGILGGSRFGAYAAANSAMDSFADLAAAQHRKSWISIMWDGWNFRTDVAPVGGVRSLAMSASEGVEALERVLAHVSSGPVAVSTADLNARIDQTRARVQAVNLPPSGSVGSAVNQSSLSATYVEPRTEMERTIADCWRAALGVERLGVNDNFFELGGHSLLGLQLMSSLSTYLQVQLSLKHLWNAPSVATLARSVEDMRAAGRFAQADLARALATIDSLSETEIERMLAE